MARVSSAAKAPRSRRWTINAIFAVAVVVGVFAVLSVWVNRQVLNTNNWTNTSSQLLADPKIEAAVGGVLVNELFSSVDVSTEIKSVLPSNLSGLASPATAGLRALAIQVAPQVLSTATVQNAWRLANRSAQLELLRILNGGSKTVSTNNGVVDPAAAPAARAARRAARTAGTARPARSRSFRAPPERHARSTVQQKLGVTLPPLSGNIVILRSSQLKTAQNIVKAIKGLALVLPLIAFGLLILAVWLAEGRRRVAVRTTGWCLVGIGLIVVLARRLIGDAVVDSLVKVPSNKPAVHQAFTIGTSLLYDAAIALITYGAVIVVAAWIAGSTRPAFSLRRAIAPSLREHVQYVYAAAALALLLLVIWGPFPSTRQPLPVIGIAVVLVLGIQASASDDRAGISRCAARRRRALRCRGWLRARRDSTVVGAVSLHDRRRRPTAATERTDRRSRASGQPPSPW